MAGSFWTHNPPASASPVLGEWSKKFSLLLCACEVSHTQLQVASNESKGNVEKHLAIRDMQDTLLGNES